MGMREVRFFDQEMETLPREAIRQIQLLRFQKQLRYVWDHSPFYRRKYERAGLEPGDIKTHQDVAKIPFTVKEELRETQAENPPWGGILCVPPEQGSRVFQTTGTTGVPLKVLLSHKDWFEIYYQQFMHYMYGFGLDKSDVLFVPFGYGLYIAWWGFQAAMELEGMTIIPGGAQSTKDRVRNIFNWNPTAICGTPTYLLHLAETARRMGTPLAESTIQTVVAAGEPGAQVPSTKKALQDYYGAECFDDIGSTEISNFGFECVAHAGTHLIESMFYPECLDPVSLEPVAEGEVGELVLSNLCTESMPLLRYRIKDLVRFDTTPCPCGRTFLRLDGGVLGRSDDMFQFAGVNIFPSGIENLIRAVDEFSSEYQILVPAPGAGGRLVIKVEPADPQAAPASLDQRVKSFLERFKYQIGVTPEIEVVEAGVLPRFEGKAKRVIRA